MLKKSFEKYSTKHKCAFDWLEIVIGTIDTIIMLYDKHRLNFYPYILSLFTHYSEKAKMDVSKGHVCSSYKFMKRIMHIRNNEDRYVSTSKFLKGHEIIFIPTLIQLRDIFKCVHVDLQHQPPTNNQIEKGRTYTTQHNNDFSIEDATNAFKYVEHITALKATSMLKVIMPTVKSMEILKSLLS